MNFTQGVQSADISIPYASPGTSRPAPRIAAGVWIGVFALALVALGGCFLLGVLVLLLPGFSSTGAAPGVNSNLSTPLMIVLYLLAFACFGGAVALLVVSIRILLGFGRGSVEP